jgi:hypothetical protein
MGSEKAWYWIAVGVLALLVSNNFAARHTGDVRCVASRSLSAVERVSGHASRVVVMAEMMLGRGGSRFDHAQMAVDGVQTRLVLAQNVLARHEAAFARVQAEHERMVAIEELRGTVICPRPNLRIVIPEPPAMRMDGTI